MKTLIVLFLISLGCSVIAQKPIFIRVYGLKGTKIFRGNVFTVTDSSVSLVGKKAPVNIPVSVIGSIKTKHSVGNNILIGSIAGATTFAIIGAASADPNELFFPTTAGEGALEGIIIGAPIGAALGGLTYVFKNADIFLINGDPAKLKEFQSFVLRKQGKEK